MTAQSASADLEAFREAAQSLKLYRRADIPGAGGESLIEELYVDPLPNDHVFHTMVKANTTFIVGRKGTGKSTIFLRAQHALRQSPRVASAYVDIKTLYGASQVDPQLLERVSALNGTLPPEEIKQLILYRQFLTALIQEIRAELAKRIKVSSWTKVKRRLGGTLTELFADFDALLAKAHDDHFINVLGTLEQQAVNRDSNAEAHREGFNLEAVVGPEPAIKAGFEASGDYSSSNDRQREYAEVLMRVFDIREYIAELRELLKKVDIDHLFIFVDDFSELPSDAMKVVVDSIIAPLNNWSNELVKFKIAAYPGRIYYGEIDKTKIDEINLDLFSLYGSTDVAGMEDKAIDFTKRLIEKRIQHYGEGVDISTYLVREYQRDSDEIWRQLFYATMANPRNLGYILYFLYEADLLYGRGISLPSIREAARRYYEDKIEAYFNMGRFLQETFEERSSIFSLRELLDEIVRGSRSLRSRPTSTLMREIEGRPPTSHFHVASSLESLLGTLELNFFVTKYFVRRDRDARPVTIFALNFGLCQKETIEFYRPSGGRAYRHYLIERALDFTPVLQQYLRTNQEISCGHCRETFEPDMLPALQIYGMQCPKCKVGTCSVTNLSRKYESTLRAVRDESLLPQVELGIIHSLGTEPDPQFAADVAGELDCSYQLVGKRARALNERGLVNREKNENGRRIFSITERARQIYMQPMEFEAPEGHGADEETDDA